MLPQPTTRKLPVLITGGSQQDPDWFKRLDNLSWRNRCAELQFNGADTEDTMKRLADDILPDFSGPDVA